MRPYQQAHGRITGKEDEWVHLRASTKIPKLSTIDFFLTVPQIVVFETRLNRQRQANPYSQLDWNPKS